MSADDLRHVGAHKHTHESHVSDVFKTAENLPLKGHMYWAAICLIGVSYSWDN